ncbi:MAG: hypothetical protein ACYCW6_19170 [Candidatus Xenobia bacterium]
MKIAFWKQDAPTPQGRATVAERDAAKTLAGYLGDRAYDFRDVQGNHIYPAVAVDTCMVSGQGVQVAYADDSGRKTREYLPNEDRLRYFLARHALKQGKTEAEVHALVETPRDMPQQLHVYEQLADTGITYKTAKGNVIPASPGLLPYLAELSGRNLKFYIPGKLEGQSVEDEVKLRAAVRLLHPPAEAVSKKRLERVQTLLDHQFSFSGGEQDNNNANAICVDQAAGFDINFYLPGSSTPHVLPGSENWDPASILTLAQVRQRGDRLIKGDSPLQSGSKEYYDATQIAGEYTDATLDGYLRAIAGNPDDATASAAADKFKQQIAQLDQRLTQLESRGRQDALSAMDVQTQFLSDSLGQKAARAPFAGQA